MNYINSTFSIIRHVLTDIISWQVAHKFCTSRNSSLPTLSTYDDHVTFLAAINNFQEYLFEAYRIRRLSFGIYDQYYIGIDPRVVGFVLLFSR